MGIERVCGHTVQGEGPVIVRSGRRSSRGRYERSEIALRDEILFYEESTNSKVSFSRPEFVIAMDAAVLADGAKYRLKSSLG